MLRFLFLITISIFLIIACTQEQVQPQSESGPPFVDAYKQAKEIKKTTEDRKDLAEEILADDDISSEVGSKIDSQSDNKEGKVIQSDITEDTEDDKLPVIEYYSVVKIVDGDTIDVNIDGKIERIRFIGLNTPETVDPRKPVECFGQEASKKANELLLGQEVYLEVDPTQGDRDKYGRLLRYVYLKDGTDVALKLISNGYGYEYTYDLPYKNQDQYNKAEAQASEGERGLWAPGMCVEEVKESNPKQSAPKSEITIALPAITRTAVLKITYIHYDGEEGRTEPDEYVEIKNTGEQANLKNYTLLDESGKNYTFKDFNLAANQSVKIYTGYGDDTGSSLYWCFTSSAIWNNSGDMATLKNPSGEIVDTYSYKK